MQCMLRNYTLRVTGAPGADPYGRDVEFRCRLDGFWEADFNKGASTRKNNTFPVMALEGPVRTVRMAKIPCDHEGEKGCRQGLWEYPWPGGVPEEQIDGDGRRGKAQSGASPPLEWFFPDALEHALVDDVEVKCLTIARWERAWDHRWYAAGLVLQDHTCVSFSSNRSEKRNALSRIGYFEHSWSTANGHWNEDGERQIVFLV